MTAVSTGIACFAYLRLLAIETDMSNLATIVASLLGYPAGGIFAGLRTIRAAALRSGITTILVILGSRVSLGASLDGIIGFFRFK